jgi:hypothetical protein
MKQTVMLSASLQRHLNAYAMAASAAGVATLALTQPVEAKIVYTKVHIDLPHRYPLNLNHGKVAPFSIRWYPGSGNGGSGLSIRPTKHKSQNQIWGTVSYTRGPTHQKRYVASALSAGVTVGPNSMKFQAKNTDMFNFGSTGIGSQWWSGGQWRDAQNKYLGLKFYVNSKPHYGWARLTVSIGGDYTLLTGYAYETIPNKPIITGKTKGPDVVAVHPGSLGALAAGASGRSGK